MKIPSPTVRARLRAGGWALLATLSLTAAASMVMVGVLSWTNNSTLQIARNNEYYATTYAAEAATEKAMTGIVSDYENYGEPLVYSRLATYSNAIPSSSDNSYWANYLFSAATNQNNLTVINRINPTNIVILGPPYEGLYMLAATYDIISTAQNTHSDFGIQAAVGQQLNLGTIPIFQFAIFYQNTMEIDPGAPMLIRGLVHGNANIYLNPNPNEALTFSNDVSASGNVILGENPLDPSTRSAPNSVTFDGYDLSSINPLVLPVGTNNSGNVTNVSQNVSAILQIPPASESPTSATGTNRLYNQADMIILISNNGVMVTSGVNVNNQATVISNAAWSQWLSTNAVNNFYDQRDQLTNQSVNLDVGQLRAWSATNTTLRSVLGRDVESVYIADLRPTSNMVISTNITFTTNSVATNNTYPTYPSANTYIPPVTTNTTLTLSTTHPSSGSYLGSISTNNSVSPKQYLYSAITSYSYQYITSVVTNYAYTTNYNIVAQSGVVVTNGSTLPPMGLSVVTPDPLYVIGNYNVSTNGVNMYTNTMDTSHTYPAALYADALTVLSSAWNPANSTLGISNRKATSDTVNAAVLTGNVPSNGTYYSGGVENFPRYLEDWSGQTNTYNGSMVAMFSSLVATAHWPGTGTVYNPPTRNWAFDLNFNNSTKLPPLTPRVISVNRGMWTFLNANSTSF